MSLYSGEDIKKLIKCSACDKKFSDYDEPKDLPCGFLICEQCVVNKIDETITEQNI